MPRKTPELILTQEEKQKLQPLIIADKFQKNFNPLSDHTFLLAGQAGTTGCKTQVEILFGIFYQKASKGAPFASLEQLRVTMVNYLQAHGQKNKPFVWKKTRTRAHSLVTQSRTYASKHYDGCRLVKKPLC